ncbi:Protein of unknown function [Seinonella peptonophila]|uniref:DUF2626 domain-containing protein n=2 Tax=Seinonella peptonophila TaxID=112248 RepID=A0A1M4V0M1_9BACL|nr:Protein of unknown function [Seinonella peptonophila]
MDRMFRVLGFWAFVIALMFLAGHMYIPMFLFLAQALIFVVLGYLRFTEKTYMYLFGSYMFLSFCGMVVFATFK